MAQIINIEKIIKKLKGDIIDPLTNYYDEYEKEQEEDLRSDLIDKFFGMEILGWDMHSDEHLPPSMREVRRENKRKVQGRQKYPDYIFIINKHDKFYAEAKKIAVKIHKEVEPAIQIRRYGKSHNLPLCILTNATEFAIYDTTVKVRSKSDSVRTARVFYCTYKQLLDPYENDKGITNFEYIYRTFSKEAVVNKSLDNIKTQKGNQPLDKEFLEIIDEWRLMLAKSIASNNSKMDEVDKLNYSVQKIIDRIIFLRIAEDKDIEDYETLLKLLNSPNIYKGLYDLFGKAFGKYNSELFEPEEWLCSIKVDDAIFAHIINELYESYAFSVMPVDILGNIYEQFLGKTIKLTENNNVKIEQKPDVRKAGGVYYTPQYIVEYIVRNAVDEKIKGKTPEEISKIKILDPACGSGSFLIGAYQHLLDYHFDYYWEEGRRKQSLKQGKIYHTINNDYYLSIPEKQRILQNNIFGVDIDKQAVEVTRLSLLLTLMKEENKEIEQEGQGKLFKDSNFRYLPKLKNNIKCGNSLIGPDFYNDKNMALFGDVEQINAFDWNDREKGFGEIMGKGKFDVIIGNPPYGALLSQAEKVFIERTYHSYEYQINSFSFFIEKAITLLKKEGLVSYIVPAVFLAQHYFMNLRKYIIENCEIQTLLSLNYKVFEDAETGDTAIFVLSKEANKHHNNTLRCAFIDSEKDIESADYCKKKQSEYLNNDRLEFYLSDNLGPLSKIQSNSIPLGKIANCIMGIKPYQTGKGKPKQNAEVVTNRIYDSETPKNKLYKQYLIGKDIDRYIIKPKEKRYIKYGDWLAEPRIGAPFERAKIIVRQTSDTIKGVIDDCKYYNLNNIYNIELLDKNYDYRYLLGILNSKLMVYVYQAIVPEKGRVFAEIKKVNLDKLPIQAIREANSKKSKLAGRLIVLVDQMLETQKKAHSVKSENDKYNYQQKIKILDRQIDAMVYTLYDLTYDGVKVIDPEFNMGKDEYEAYLKEK